MKLTTRPTIHGMSMACKCRYLEFGDLKELVNKLVILCIRWMTYSYRDADLCKNIFSYSNGTNNKPYNGIAFLIHLQKSFKAERGEVKNTVNKIQSCSRQESYLSQMYLLEDVKQNSF